MLRLERLPKKNLSLFNKAMEVYEYSFPWEERRDEDEHRRVMQKEDYHFEVLMDENDFVGIMFFWETEEFIFLEHFAVKKELRNNGSGKAALDLLKKRGKPVVLEIEPPVDKLTNRRKGFYERNGFLLNPHYHIQPKYHWGDQDLELKIMSAPKVLSEMEYRRFYDYVIREASVHAE